MTAPDPAEPREPASAAESEAPQPSDVAATPNAQQSPRPRQPRNDFSWAGLVLGIIAVGVSVTTDAGYGPGLAGLLFSAIGVYVATRHDLGMARSLSGALLSLFALAVAVYTAGITSYQ